MSSHAIRVTGPKDRLDYSGTLLVNTTSHNPGDVFSGLSPFRLGPVELYAGRTARVMENAWQFAKVYPEYLDGQGNPAEAYWKWAEQGWQRPDAVRYPKGKGAKPAYLFWDGSHLGYLEARARVYFALYRDAVRQTAAWKELLRLVQSGQAVTLWDFDGYDHEAMGWSLAQVLQNPHRPMGHAFVLKAMLLYGEDVSADTVLEKEGCPQANLF
jgi:hypothetical protein